MHVKNTRQKQARRNCLSIAAEDIWKHSLAKRKKINVIFASSCTSTFEKTRKQHYLNIIHEGFRHCNIKSWFAWLSLFWREARIKLYWRLISRGGEPLTNCTFSILLLAVSLTITNLEIKNISIRFNSLLLYLELYEMEQSCT